MEEAESLGDRVCILKEGKVVACAHPNTLRKEHGAGYLMKVEPINNDTDDMDKLADCIQEFLERIQSNEMIFVTQDREQFMEAKYARFGPNMFMFTLPLEVSEHFKELFNLIDLDKERLNVKSYTIRPSSLEEIFLRIMM